MNFQSDFIPILAGAVAAMTPLLFAALGGLFTELTGMLNIALEGLIALGAFFGVIGASVSGNLALGVGAGVCASTAAALLYGGITLRLKANEFITGLATNLLASGLTVVLSQQFFNTKAVVPFKLPHLPVVTGSLAAIPILGPAVFGQNLMTQLSWLAAFLAWALIRRTPFGMRLRATGSNPKALVALGLKPARYRLAAILLSGAACGLAGSYLSLNLSAYVPNKLGPRLDSPRGDLSGRKESDGYTGGLLRLRPRGKLFELCPGGVQDAQRFHTRHSLCRDSRRPRGGLHRLPRGEARPLRDLQDRGQLIQREDALQPQGRETFPLVLEDGPSAKSQVASYVFRHIVDEDRRVCRKTGGLKGSQVGFRMGFPDEIIVPDVEDAGNAVQYA